MIYILKYNYSNENLINRIFRFTHKHNLYPNSHFDRNISMKIIFHFQFPFVIHLYFFLVFLYLVNEIH